MTMIGFTQKEMEKRGFKCHCPLGSVISISFVFWVLLLYLVIGESSNIYDSWWFQSQSSNQIPQYSDKKSDGNHSNTTLNINNPDPVLSQNQSLDLIHPLENKNNASEVQEKNISTFFNSSGNNSSSGRSIHHDPCSGRYIYVHQLPSRFNLDFIKQCKTVNKWMDMCESLSNFGLGPRLNNKNGVFSEEGWFDTNQFTVEVIFSNRMKQYECLTSNSSKASAIFIPVFPGFDIVRYLWEDTNVTIRDSMTHDLIKWLTSKPEWRVMGGRDHFLVAGRVTWDFRRQSNEISSWGNKLFELPESKNMTMLVIEASPWHSNDFGIPYPTYFHPSNETQILEWQKRMDGMERPYLFSFAGAPRPSLTDSIRNQLIEQCQTSKRCNFVSCNSPEKKCNSPSHIMNMFQSSVFSLQPQGDSSTRRSSFDSILAGCIPVFFHATSAYTQYVWYLPKNYTKYSVYISENDVREGKVSIEEILLRISKETAKEMRKEIINLIPKIIYADPRDKAPRFKDAFEVAINGVLEKINVVKRNLEQGIENIEHEMAAWKHDKWGRVKEKEWDKSFAPSKSQRRR